MSVTLNEACRTFQTADLIQNFNATSLGGEWYPIYKSKQKNLLLGPKRCSKVKFSNWDLSKNSLVKDFEGIDKMQGFTEKTAYFAKAFNFPMKKTLHGWVNEEGKGVVWGGLIPRPSMKASDKVDNF